MNTNTTTAHVRMFLLSKSFPSGSEEIGPGYQHENNSFPLPLGGRV
jgi:hypothetical protein